MKINTNDLAVFALLEEAGYADFDPTKIAVFDFHFDNQYHLCLFMPEGKQKGCRLYSFPQTDHQVISASSLLEDILSLPEEDGYGLLTTQALSLLEKRVREHRADQLFFDAH
jgi:hypothetical protein